MKGLHWISVGVIAVALLLLAFAFISITGNVRSTVDNAPQTGLFVAQNNGSQAGAAQAADCAADPRKCVNDPNNGSKTAAG